MKKEARWLYSECVISILIELAREPLTPMQLRARTGMTKNNYVNIILKRLGTEGIVKCLNPEVKIGKVFCIKPEAKDRVNKIFKNRGIEQKVNSLPELKWKAYGKLLCRYCVQIRSVFKKSFELMKEGKQITVCNLKEKLPRMATGDIYRALNKLIELEVMACQDKSPKEFLITKEGVAIAEFMPDILVI